MDMKIDFNNQQNTYNSSFSARNPEIRFADNVARRVNQCFPRISTTIMEASPNIDSFFGFLEDMRLYLVNMRNKLERDNSYASGFKEQLHVITDTIKEFKLGNCIESAMLTEIAARTNGIKDCKTVLLLERGEMKWLDHAVVLVENKRKPYIIDSWLGFADYVPNALKRYESEYAKHFDFKYHDGMRTKLSWLSANCTTTKIFSQKYSQEELRSLYSELIVPSK